MADRTVTCSTADITLAASTAPRLAKLQCDTDSSDSRWDAPHPYSISVSGPSWSSQLQYVELPGVSGREGCRVVRRGDASRHPTPFRPLHLHDTPLLI